MGGSFAGIVWLIILGTRHIAGGILLEGFQDVKHV